MDAFGIDRFKKTLLSEIQKSSNIFITGHLSPDFDSIGACMGLYTIGKYYGKKCYIVVDDDPITIEPGIKTILDANHDQYSFVTKKEAIAFQRENTLLMVTDVNKKDMICFHDMLEEFSSIVVIDHHLGDEHSIPGKSFIHQQVSSASEIISYLLFSCKIPVDASLANYLLAGINLDTKRYKQNTTSQTHDISKQLMDCGADIDYVNHLFLEEFESFCRVSHLMINGTIIKKYSESMAPIQVSFTLNREQPKSIYGKEDYAKAADRMLKFNGIDASFALGYIDEENIHISARGGKKVNVGKIMESMNGGGNYQCAAAKVKSSDIFLLEQELMEKVPLGLPKEERIYEEPPTIKIKKIH